MAGNRYYSRRSYNRGRDYTRGTWRHKYNKNEFIRSKEVQLIDAEGENHGIVPIEEAMSLAKKADLDLIEVAPKASPPVCKIMSWSKFIYQQKKKEKNARKHKQKELKEVRFGTFIDTADRDRLLKRAKEFLDKGHNVKVTVTRKGRTPVEQSKDLLNELLTALSEYSTIDSKPSFEGRRISIVFKGFSGKTQSSESPDEKGKKTYAKAKNQQDSSKEVQEDKAKGRKGRKDSLQQKQTGTSKDKKDDKKKA